MQLVRHILWPPHPLLPAHTVKEVVIEETNDDKENKEAPNTSQLFSFLNFELNGGWFLSAVDPDPSTFSHPTSLPIFEEAWGGGV